MSSFYPRRDSNPQSIRLRIFSQHYVAIASANAVAVRTMSSPYAMHLGGRCIVSTHLRSNCSLRFSTALSRREFRRLACIHSESFLFGCSTFLPSPLCMPIPPRGHGAEGGTRIRSLLSTNQMRYQLRHFGMRGALSLAPHSVRLTRKVQDVPS